MANDPLRPVEALGDLAGMLDTVKQNLLARGWAADNAEKGAIATVQGSLAVVAAQAVAKRQQ